MSPREVDCPTCPARIGQPCRSLFDMYEVPDHPGRSRLASALTGDTSDESLRILVERAWNTAFPKRFVGYDTGANEKPPVSRKPRPDQRAAFRDRVAADLHALTDGLDMPPAPRECPPPPPELTDTYAVAFASAARRCTHPRSVDTVYARRERFCTDCHRYFTATRGWGEF